MKKESEQDIDCQTSYYRTVLQSLPLREHQAETKHHHYRPISPIKLLSKVFSGDVGISKNSLKSSREVPTNLPSLPMSSPIKEKTNKDINASPKDSRNKVTLLDTDNGAYRSPVALLEDTFIAYIVALRFRCGNVVGKVLRNRASADELAVNELYNTLLEDPNRLNMAAEVSVDVLFAAFEKFLRVAWRERMGPLVAPMAIQNLQSNLEAGRPTFFAQDVKKFLEEMPPQSRRCFATMIKLLLELLDASGNDGDRGTLMASFAEALVLVGNPHEYITLLDRLVDDYDHLFEDAVDKPASSGSATGSISRSINTGSIGSNTSSLRRKFGLGNGLSRENSKNDSDSKVASIWRQMSKNARSPADSHLQSGSQPGSISKVSLVRSRSTDTAPKMLFTSRPGSRDRPPSANPDRTEELQSRPGSSHNTFAALKSIGENMTVDANTLRKKKRRSSLSDLVNIKSDSPLALPSSIQPREVPPRASSTKTKTLPRTPSPRKPSREDRPNRPSPSRTGLSNLPVYSQGRQRSPFTVASKENSPSSRASPAKKNSDGPTREATTKVTIPANRNTSRSKIPAPKSGGLSERTWPQNGNNTPPKKPTPDGSPRKLRIQSPQKLRERLSQEQRSLAGDQNSLQEEIDKIAQELSTFKLRPHTPTTTAKTQTIETLSHRLDTLSQTLTTFTKTHAATTTHLRTELDTSHHYAERKARKLDELYKEANAENEALYDRFNSELEKVLSRVRKGEGVEELRERLGTAVEETASLRAEKARLAREVAMLRSLLKE